MKNFTGRLGRWVLRSGPYRKEIGCRPGSENSIADCLSRYHLEHNVHKTGHNVHKPCFECTTLFLKRLDTRILQREDGYCSQIIDVSEGDTTTNGFRNRRIHFIIRQHSLPNSLLRRWDVVSTCGSTYPDTNNLEECSR